MSTLMANMMTFIHKKGIVPLSRVMQLLVVMVTTDASSHRLVSLCRSIVPQHFIRCLLDQIASEMVT